MSTAADGVAGRSLSDHVNALATPSPTTRDQILAVALRRLATAKRVTLLYAARDPLHNNAEVLKKLIEGDERRRTT